MDFLGRIAPPVHAKFLKQLSRIEALNKYCNGPDTQLFYLGLAESKKMAKYRGKRLSVREIAE